MSRLKLKPGKHRRLTECSVDAIPDDDGRKFLLATLRLFADTIPDVSGVPADEKFNSVVRLYEHGYLRCVVCGESVGVQMCSPRDAPQLRARPKGTA
jgi:hypothetical protein